MSVSQQTKLMIGARTTVFNIIPITQPCANDFLTLQEFHKYFLATSRMFSRMLEADWQGLQTRK